MADVSTLVQDIVADAHEVPTFAASRQYVRALKRLCEEARVWRIDGTIPSVDGTSTDDISSFFPEETELVDIISIKPVGGGEPLRAKTQSWLDENMSDWRALTASVPKYFVLEANNTIRFVPTPTLDAAPGFYVRAAIKPVVGATTEIDELVVNKYNELLINGAKGYLFMMPRKPWTDLNLAQYHMAVFESGIPGARRAAADEHQTGVARKVRYGGIA